uniref:Secreted protein n=1 Tax=Arundo donax TaxID=35708 RepID=A0A0A9B021_ARUDO
MILLLVTAASMAMPTLIPSLPHDRMPCLQTEQRSCRRATCCTTLSRDFLLVHLDLTASSRSRAK